MRVELAAEGCMHIDVGTASIMMFLAMDCAKGTMSIDGIHVVGILSLIWLIVHEGIMCLVLHVQGGVEIGFSRITRILWKN